MNKLLILLIFLSYSIYGLACAPYCNLVSQCNHLQISAYSLRDTQDHLNFCRVQFINAANRINEVCAALYQGRLANARDTLNSAIGYAEAVIGDKVRCKPKREAKTFADQLMYFRSLM